MPREPLVNGGCNLDGPKVAKLLPLREIFSRLQTTVCWKGVPEDTRLD
jgi:hypothetical protein